MNKKILILVFVLLLIIVASASIYGYQESANDSNGGGGLIISIKQCLLANGTWDESSQSCILPEKEEIDLFGGFDKDTILVIVILGSLIMILFGDQLLEFIFGKEEKQNEKRKS